MLTVRERAGRQRRWAWQPSDSPIRVGRRPDYELTFDPEHDLAVSLSHAEIRWSGRRWSIADAGSTNGTWINGERLEEPRVLRDGDRIALGRGGPELDVEAVRRSGRIPLLVGLGGLGGVAIAASALLWLSSERSELAGERQRLQALADSLVAASALQEREDNDRLAGATRDLSTLRDDLARAQRALADAEANVDVEQLQQLQRELLDANGRLERYRLAASIDATAIERDNENAIALVFARQPDGSAITGTAFSVTPDAVLVTAGHVADAAVDGEIAVRFAHSTQTWRATVLQRANDVDLALLRVPDIVGTVPTVGELFVRSSTLGPGRPVALLGFPLGGAPQDASSNPEAPRPVTLLGLTEATAPDRLTLDTYGRPGASGSPVFDGEGRVLGVLVGAPRDGPAGTVYAVPTLAVVQLLNDAGVQTLPTGLPD